MLLGCVIVRAPAEQLSCPHGGFVVRLSEWSLSESAEQASQIDLPLASYSGECCNSFKALSPESSNTSEEE